MVGAGPVVKSGYTAVIQEIMAFWTTKSGDAMYRNGALCCLLAFSLFLSGCGDKSEKVLGYWKSQNDQGGWHSLLEFAKERMTLDEVSTDIAMETKDGKVVVRKAGTDAILAIIGIVDDNNLDVEVDGKKIRYVKSGKDEHARLVAASPKEKALGFWKTHSRVDGRTTILEIGKDYINDDGKERLPLVRNMDGGRLLLEFGESKQLGVPAAVSFRDDDHIEISSPWLGKNDYERVSAEAAARILAPTPEMILGYWSSSDDILEITDNSFNLNGAAVPALLRAARKSVIAVDPKDEDRVIARLRVNEDGGLALDRGPMSGDTIFVTASPEEVKAKLDAFAKMAEDAVGVWMSEKTGRYKRGRRDFMVIAPDSYTRNDRTTAAAIRPVPGGVEIVSEERSRSPLTKIKIVDETHIEAESGGFMSETVVFVKTTPKRMELLTNPQPDALNGYWISEEGTGSLPAENAAAISASSFEWNGVTTETVAESTDGEIRIKAKASNQVVARIVFRGTEEIELQASHQRDSKVFQRASREEYESVLAAYRAALAKAVGFWLSEKEHMGRKGGHQILEITTDRVVFNNE